MRVQLVNLTSDKASAWLLELFEYVVDMMSPDFEEIELLVTESYQQARSRLDPEGSTWREMGVTGIIRGPQGLNEDPPWKASIKVAEGIPTKFTLIEKPSRIRELETTYEEVTEGMAHELAEAMVLKRHEKKCLSFSLDQIGILSSYHADSSVILESLAMLTRERLADKLYVEHGFAREAFCGLSEKGGVVINHALAFENGLRTGISYPILLSGAFGFDRSISLNVAGEYDLADEWIDLWSSLVKRRAPSSAKFMDDYRGFRQEFLSMPFTANSLLTLFNSRTIESI